MILYRNWGRIMTPINFQKKCSGRLPAIIKKNTPLLLFTSRMNGSNKGALSCDSVRAKIHYEP